MQEFVRVRFAPSPTGPLHIGGVRTALYNYLFARHHQGTFILRIEDTDQKRFVPGAEQYIIDALSWCGLVPSEGPDMGGSSGPYRQSERTAIYKQEIVRLLESGMAYYAFDTPEALEKARKDAEKEGKDAFQYNALVRNQMINGLTLSPAEVQERIDRGDPYVIRIRIPENETIHFTDLIRGTVSVNTRNLDDKVLFKSDGLPTYHFANVVDDHLMKITHVIRGEEWLPSAPLHLLLYRYLGWEDQMPRFAHLPLILKPEGSGKLSKRDGDRLGFPVFPLRWTDPVTGEVSKGYREEGYLPQAFINFLALLGWHPATEQELFTLDELTKQFSLERITKSGARFDPEKAIWFNHQTIQNLPVESLMSLLIRFMDFRGEHKAVSLLEENREYTQKVLLLVRERANLLSDLWLNAALFYMEPDSYDETVLSKIWRPDTQQHIQDLLLVMQAIEPWDVDILFSAIKDFIREKELKMGQIMNPLRLLVVGDNQGPGMMDIAVLLGKAKFLNRIETGLKQLGQK